MRWLWRGLLALAILVVLAAGGGFLWLRTSLPQEAGTVRLAGPTAPVEILRDAHGVPHIFAETEADAYFALGFVHAQDRLWQMEMLRRLPAGRLSEIVGARALPIDRFMRVLGVARLAEASLDALAPDVRRAMDAYTAGVNAWLDDHRGALPPTFVLLGHQPERWRPVDSILWGALMSLQLSGNWRDELLRARLARDLDSEAFALLFPDYPDNGPVTLEQRAALYRSLPLDRLRAALPAESAQVVASNEWAVSGARTRSGRPLLANDPHLGFSAPGLWYLARIVTPDWAVTGATVAGVPFVILGHNRHIAWGFTTTNGDLMDLFVERLDPSDPDRYLAPDGPRPFARRQETIRVRGGEDVALSVRETRHGPVIDDLVAGYGGGYAQIGGAGHVLALAASFINGENRTAEAAYRLNHARDWGEFERALALWQAPQQNVVYADTAGNIGFYAPARVPIRGDGNGYLPSPGWTGTHDWEGFIPFGELPHALNPPRGVIVNANNRVTPPGYPHFISRDWEAPYRARRIEALLAGAERLDVAGMATMQADELSLAARELVPLLLAAPADDDRARAAEAMLAGWDGRMRRDRPEPLLYMAWTWQLSRGLLAPLLGASLDDYMRLRPGVLARMLREGGRWCDDPATADRREGCPERLAAARAAALDRLERRYGGDMARWQWGKAHQAAFRHAVLGRLPLVGGLANLSVATGGGDYTINRGTTSFADPEAPFRHVHGAGFRAIYDLADLSASRFMQATGQSGNILSRHYRDLNQGWADFDYIGLGASREALRAEGARRLILQPADGG